ncbi:arginyl-tRNA synthetase [Aliivibrio fischeri ES114]|uniref:Arginine--tRNA ligase n=1 Tax=Aliivibrio fischeri (strain ATCC 700601 / ES114) TaxID=312309 RepID=SYR_ALIF1|nr:arginine--tRNA ligase [Aliivibrio fischeri]Q5E6L2.1 RecName: Full=Arginine--tRNA ligase; AltName: Full=Arginyl-tRNA synthetase; Short=ArgRS [Aliivibrio fischeri ES114]AAW85334.1 arginyl-tRNA synthetase [Aliivibrio fischeri ES114]KLU78426.1 arginyl-tRNA synthetase [Aliivibrio fischeri]MUI54180.1 arginine--tRNA ligase [Aliivibrio fischeri]MUJ36211.1 arginine--tRNA ligase [Aliivibrio fischeri]
MNIQSLINDKVSQALEAAGAPAGSPAAVRQSAKAQFGDYQANGVMGVAKRLGTNPREFAQKVLDVLDLDGIASKTEIAGPGFINIFLSEEFLAKQAEAALADERLGVAKEEQQNIVADYSAPNVAKEMHVGHLRSTIIGDAVVRTLEFLGHNVTRANHIGDWGTQFGMLIANLERIQKEKGEVSMELSDLEGFYRESKKLYDEDEEFAVTARGYVVKLQSGDEFCAEMWKKLVDVTMVQNQRNYDRLNVSLTRDNVMGESMYNSMLAPIVADLQKQGLAVESEGAQVVFLDEYKNKDGEPMGVIVQKRDGGFLYTTTDIACAKYRYEELNADRVLYFIDSRQHQHLMQAWTIVRKAGYVPESVSLEHHAFGMMLGKDGRPFKTRAGGTVRLADLLDEAEERATKLIEEKNKDLSAEEKAKIATTVAMAAVKYSDLSKHRTTDYIFDWDNMLAFEGNTAPYMQYAYTRVASIFSKAGLSMDELTGEVKITDEKEKALVAKLMQFEEAVQAVASEGQPHLMCAYLFELAGQFSSFYEACPILNNEDDAVKQSRLKLAALTAKTIKQGLELLGIETLERM